MSKTAEQVLGKAWQDLIGKEVLIKVPTLGLVSTVVKRISPSGDYVELVSDNPSQHNIGWMRCTVVEEEFVEVLGQGFTNSFVERRRESEDEF